MIDYYHSLDKRYSGLVLTVVGHKFTTTGITL